MGRTSRRPVDSMGRLPLPTDMMAELGIKTGTKMDIQVEAGVILVRISVPACLLCGIEVAPTAAQMDGKFVCGGCLAVLAG